jgi:DNA-binding GntR family transcriptional regulator
MTSFAAHKTGRPPPPAGPYEKLKLMILDGELAGGEPLVERPLAERLGVSRTPVRETIFRLEREGLVRVIEGKGAFVASYTLEDMIEIYQMREGLEPLAARLACDYLADADLLYHETQLKRYRARPALRQENPVKWRLLGRDFHNLFIHASKNARLIHTIESMRHQIELFRGLGGNLNPRTDLKSAVDEHWDILQALRTRNPQRAEKAVRTHLQNGLRQRIEALHGTR